MMHRKDAHLNAATLRRAVETGTACRSVTTSSYQYKTDGGAGQAGIAGLLMAGSENGLHLQDLVRITGQTERAVRKQIHAERRRGVPILSDNVCGYFLPSTDEERAACVRSLRHRAREILRAARAIEQGEG